MFSYDKNFCPFQIIAMEKRFFVPLQVNLQSQITPVYIGGFIDRIDQTREGIRIIDYKTGTDTTSFKDMASLFDSTNPNRNKAAFQTMLYCLMFGHTHPSEYPLIPGIYNTKLLFGKAYDFHLQYDNTPVQDFRRYQEEFLAHLHQLLAELFSSDTSFHQTENTKKCINCSYSKICRR